MGLNNMCATNNEPKMYIYKLTRKPDTDRGGYYYDTYDSCVVVAKDVNSALLVKPDSYCQSWIDYSVDPICTLIGEASPGLKEGTVICASFNAG
jgi:hypothetical protein